MPLTEEKIKRRMKNFNPCVSEEFANKLMENPELCRSVILQDKITARKVHKIVAKHMLKLFKTIMKEHKNAI